MASFSKFSSISSTVDEDAALVAVEQLVVARDISRCQFTGFDSGIAGWIISPESSWEVSVVGLHQLVAISLPHFCLTQPRDSARIETRWLASGFHLLPVN
jgi:hypothetical protein